MIGRMSTPTPIVYGIPNCDTVKKARSWLTEHGVEYRFHDFKKQGVPAERLSAWMASLGWEPLVNRQGTTWRKLDPQAQAAVCDPASAAALLQAQPSAIKRPVVEWTGDAGGEVTVGFQDARWNERLAAASKR
ncbi:ArsC family reductase [Paracidovorax avenae]|uniref:ArsC family reductase n=1 Tax=Paracidovorax avenae TaxID=80867 RepID=UPI000D17C3F7|nr:ArsC family reductase [Paracidovorax avenae]AVS88160.1 ArsC family reductase [Paracidovorax avenae]